MIKVDFISPKSMDGVVNSVNGKYGTVELTAEDLGATTKEYVDKKVLEAQTGGVDLSGYATETYVNDAVANVKVDLTGYATETYVAEQIAGIEHPTTDLTGYATETYVDEAVGGIVIPTPDFTGYATETYVDEAIAAIPEVDLTGFYDKEEIDAMLEETGGSVSVDGTTIIQNEDGTISTTLGGGRVKTADAVNVYEFNDETGVTTPGSNYVRITIPETTYVPNSLDASIIYDFEIDVLDVSTGITDTFIGTLKHSSSYEWNIYGEPKTGKYCFNYIYFASYQSDGVHYQNYIDYNGSGFVFEQHYITGIRIIKPATYEYTQIDANYIPNTSPFIGNNDFHQIIQYNNEVQVASNEYCVGLGLFNKVGGQGSVALGVNNIQYSTYGTQYTIGDGNKTYNWGVHTLGANNTLYASNSMALGFNNEVRSSYQTVLGRGNVSDNSSTYALIVGVNGSNGFTLDWSGNGAFTGTVSSTGADYAEYFEWLDGNPEGEDRVGYMVALDGDKIRKAVPGDEVLGVISGTIAVLGDNYEANWQGKYLTDDFGRVLVDMVEEFGEEGDSLGFFPYPKLNPEYNPEEEYVPRAKRKEWDAVGMMGKLFVRDDGKAQPNDYITVGADGVATVSAEKTNMRMLSRKGDNIIRILMK